MRRILHIVSNLNRGGAETMIMNIYRNINKTKIQFDFLCLSNISGDYEEEIINYGGEIHKICKKNRIKQIYEFLKKYKERYNVIHIHIMFYSGIICYIAKKVKIQKIIVHSHSSDDIKKENIMRKIYMHISRILINKYADVKISCGMKAGIYLYGEKQKYIILKNGIDLEKFIDVKQDEIEKLRDELNINKEEFIIGHVGNFLEVKNQEFFIEFAKQFKKYKTKFKIILVGYGKMFDYIKDLIKKEKLEDYFILTGKRNDINIFMNIFNIFIMPSLYEGFPLVVVEALAGDNICFLSDKISKETKIIESRVNFFDLEESKEKLVQDILENIKNIEKIDLKKKLIEEGFSIKEMTKQIEKIYEL